MTKRTLVVLGAAALVALGTVGVATAVAASRDKAPLKPALGSELRAYAACLRAEGVRLPSLNDLLAGKARSYGLADLQALLDARAACGDPSKALEREVTRAKKAARSLRACLRERGIDRASLLQTLLGGLRSEDVQRLSKAYAACRGELPSLGS
jgi:hypothetical protein